MPAPTRGRASLHVAAGAAFAIGVWVRPTNGLMVIPIALAVRLRWHALVSIAVGALPFIIALMVWNAKLYGGPFRTGYGGVDLSWEGVLNAGPEHVEWLRRILTDVVFPGGLFVLFDRRVETWTRWMLVLWFAVFYVFYSFYGFWDGLMCLRFLLPGIPALIYGALLVLRDLAAIARGKWRIATTALAGALAVWICVAPMTYSVKFHVFGTLKTVETAYPQYIEFTQRHVPRRAIVITGVLCGAFFDYEHRSIVRYDQLNDERFQILRAYVGNHNLPWYVVVTDDELDFRALRQRFRGDWAYVDHFGTVTIYRLRS